MIFPHILHPALSSRCMCFFPPLNLPLSLPSLPQSSRAKEQVGQQLHRACRDVGFFYVKNHGMPEDLQRGVLSLARTFFHLPVRPGCMLCWHITADC